MNLKTTRSMTLLPIAAMTAADPGRALRRTSLAVTLLAALLGSGCAPIVLGGVWVGTVMTATDRRTSGTQVEDQTIELKSGKRVGEVVGESAHVNVTSYNRIVLLTGEVPREADRATVERAVAGIENVKGTVNELTVAGASSLTARSNDTVITGKVKTSLVEARDIQSNSIKVVTERGVVYLMGIVSEREAKRATDVARGVGGVARVVRVFDVVSEAELARLQPPAEPAKKPAQ